MNKKEKIVRMLESADERQLRLIYRHIVALLGLDVKKC